MGERDQRWVNLKTDVAADNLSIDYKIEDGQDYSFFIGAINDGSLNLKKVKNTCF